MKNCNYPSFVVSLEHLEAQNVGVMLDHPSGTLTFFDKSEFRFPLFDGAAIDELVNQFGAVRTDAMLDEAGLVIRREMMAEKIRRAMRE